MAGCWAAVAVVVVPSAASVGHLKNTEVLTFGAALGFSHCLVHLMPIGAILRKINQYLDLPNRLRNFRVNMGGPNILKKWK